MAKVKTQLVRDYDLKNHHFLESHHFAVAFLIFRLGT